MIANSLLFFLLQCVFFLLSSHSNSGFLVLLGGIIETEKMKTKKERSYRAMSPQKATPMAVAIGAALTEMPPLPTGSVLLASPGR